jgi:RNA polymerase sigma factor for flagellar operon FliA
VALLQTIDSCELSEPQIQNREELILQCMPVVYAIARRLIAAMSTEVALEDLVSAGTVGLIHAVDNYDSGMQVKLQTYAAHRIRGAMLDNLRDHDWFSRRQRGHLKRVQEALGSAQAKHQSSQVSDEAIAAEMGVSVEQYRDTIASLPVTRVVSLEETANEDGETFEPIGGESPSEILERAEMAQLLQNALSRIPEEERTILSLYYDESLTPQEIAQVINYPIKRVYQLKAQGILRLRSSLGRRLLRRQK